MRVTAASHLFSGPTTYPSNMAKISVKYLDKDYSSNEQAYQCIKAVKHDNKDLANTLKELTDAPEIKDEAAVIVVSDEWNDKAPDFLMELFDEEMKQNPRFLERLY